MSEGLGKRAEKVYCRLRQDIEDGRLKPGRRLPTQHELSRQLRVSRSTVQTALKQLVKEGLVIGRRGSGMFVQAGVQPETSANLVGVMCERMKTDGFILQEQLLRYRHLGCFYFQKPNRWSVQAERVYLQQLLRARPKALIACCSPAEPPNTDCIEALAKHGCRVIHVSPFERHLPRQEYLMPDYSLAGYEAGVRLYTAGYDHFCFCGVASDGPYVSLMEEGYATALRENGEDYRHSRDYVELAAVGWSGPSAQGFRDALERGETIGVFARSRWLAKIVRRQLDDWDVAMPEQVGIVVHDSHRDQTETEGKGFDTVGFDRAEIMRQAVVWAVDADAAPIRELVQPRYLPQGTIRETE